MQRDKAVKGSGLSPSSALHPHARVLADQAVETALFDLPLVILTTLGCRLDISLAYMLQNVTVLHSGKLFWGGRLLLTAASESGGEMELAETNLATF